MAQVFPINTDDNPGGVASEALTCTLSTLPDPWTLLRDRCIGASGLNIDVVLVHPEVGIAVADEAPRDPAAVVAALCDLLERQRFADFFPGELPIVSFSVAFEDLVAIERRLAGAFDAAPRLSISDPDWADAVIELLLLPGDLVMAPIGGDAKPPRAEPVVPLPPNVEAPRDSLAPTPRTEGTPLSRVDCSGGRPIYDFDEHLIPLTFQPTARAGNAPKARRRRTIRVTLAVSAVGAFSAVIGGLVAWDKAMPNCSIAPVAEIEAPAVSQVASARPAASTSVSGSSTAFQRSRRSVARHIRRTVARHIRCADWLHQNRPGGSDYHGPPVAGCPRRR